MDLKTRIEVLPCGKCEDMIDCDTCLSQKEAKDLYKQIRTEVIEEFINKLAEELYSIHSDDNSWCEYSADRFIDEMVDVSEKLKEQNK